MTKLKLISDIHIDYDKDYGVKFINSIPNDDVDILVLAGDVVTGGHLENYFSTFETLCKRFKDVIFVLGNHCYYKHSPEEVFEIMANFQSKLPNLHWLQNEKKQIQGLTFCGTTLWFPKLPIMPSLYNWVDSRNVVGSYDAIFKEHQKAMQFLENSVDKDCIVITHHLPSPSCVHPSYKDDDYNCYFVADCDHIIYDKEPKLWLFGHSHMACDIMVGKTRCVLNPRAYPHERSTSRFNKDLIIDV